MHFRPLTPSHSRPLLASSLMVAGIVVFIVAAMASAWGLQQTKILADRRAQSYRNLVQIEGVLSTLKDLESGQRGFLITGDVSFLEPYQDARRDLEARYLAMRTDMSDIVLDKDFWGHLDELIQARVRIAQENIELRHEDRFHWDSDLQRLLDGKRAMDAVRAEFDTLERYRREEIKNISERLENSRRLAFGMAFGAGIIGLLLMLGALGMFLREQRLRLKAEAVLASANQDLENEVRLRTRDLQIALEHIRTFAGDLDQNIEAERRRLAREVHDQIGQIFTAMKLLVRSWREHFTGHAIMADQLEEFTRLLDEGINTARRITAELRPPLLDDLGLGAAIEHYFNKYGAPSGVTCRVDLLHDHVMSRSQAMALFRIAQEAITNTLRHAAAGRIVVSDHLEDQVYHFILEDDGCGLAEGAEASHGLRGMSERVKLTGGALRISPGQEGGVRIEVTLPLSED